MRYLRRGENYLRPTAKGMKPLINRPLASDSIKDAHYGWKKKYRSAGEMEDIMKKTIYGRVQFQFASEHFTDQIPWIPLTGKSAGGVEAKAPNHHYDDALYVRKYIKTAKFKKLELVAWEMPENATKVVTLDELVRAGVQYGHSSSVWNPKMLNYLYSDFEGTHIFDLVQTAAQLNRSCYYLMEAASMGAKVLIVGTKDQAGGFVKQYAEECGAFYVDQKYAGGILTNFNKLRGSINLMTKLQRENDQGAWKGLDVEQIGRNQRKLRRLYRKYKGVAGMEELPDILICIDEVKERNCILEALKVGIPTICLCDSNSNPDPIDLVIPGNASGSRSIDLVLSKLSEAIKKGRQLEMITPVGDRKEIPREFDPWLFSLDRMRVFRRKTKRQSWHKVMYGNYENYKKCNPFGNITPVGDYFDVQWNMKMSDGLGNL